MASEPFGRRHAPKSLSPWIRHRHAIPSGAETRNESTEAMLSEFRTSITKETRLKQSQVIDRARQCETACAISGQHTGITDLPLTRRGECKAQRLGRPAQT
jgi:hypothetical protein